MFLHQQKTNPKLHHQKQTPPKTNPTKNKQNPILPSAPAPTCSPPSGPSASLPDADEVPDTMPEDTRLCRPVLVSRVSTVLSRLGRPDDGSRVVSVSEGTGVANLARGSWLGTTCWSPGWSPPPAS